MAIKYYYNWNNKNQNKFIKFIGIGLISYPLTIFLTWLFTYLFNGKYIFAYSMVLGMMTVYNFFMNKKIVFNTTGKTANEFYLYIVFLFVFYSLNILLLSIATEYLDVYYLYSVVLVFTITSLFKYLIYDRLIFR